MTMQERQAELLKEQQRKKEQVKSSWGASLDQLGSLGNSPISLTPNISKPATPLPASDISITVEDDPFDIFNKPPPPKPVSVKPSQPTSSRNTPQSSSRGTPQPVANNDPSGSLMEGFTDAFPHRSTPSQTSSTNGSELSRHSTPLSENHSSSRNSPKPPASDPRDQYIAELVDMGFSVEQAKRGLANTDTGLDVRQAIDFLMNEAHRKATGKVGQQRPSSAGSNRATPNQPADISKMAQDFSNQFISKGMSFFNQGRKNIAKAIEQYSAHTPDDGTPAWMRNQEKYKHREAVMHAKSWDADAEDVDMSRVGKHQDTPSNLTSEAMALESGSRDDFVKPRPLREHNDRPVVPPRRSEKISEPSFKDDFRDDFEEPQYTPPSGRSTPRVQHQHSLPKPVPAVPSMSRAQQFKAKGFDDDMPTRRRTPKPSTPKPAAEFKSTIPDRPKPAPRASVSVSSTALDMYRTSRDSGTEAFKRGDFTEATTFYTQAITSIPNGHLLRTIVLSNRATCYMKLGDSKSALTDAEEGIILIGPGLGNEEEAEPGKSLKEIWSKLVTRKAEALESRDRYQDALDTWNQLIENGFSSKVSLDGKRRCQQALEPKKAPTPKVSKPPTRVNTPSVAAEDALRRIRAANQESEKEESEKFALVDIVEQKINSWKAGKEDNLRGLISTVDSLMWPELNWKKVSLADLVLPKKVKINYMKAVAKTHPDKIPSDATTEQKMIAQAVFVTLNKAWDDFKAANGLN